MKLFITSLLFLFFSNPIIAESLNYIDDSLEILTKDIKPGQTFKIKLNSATKLGKKAWLGIFKPNISLKNASKYNSYVYINQNNEIEMKAPTEVGEYQLRLYTNDPGDLIKTIKFNVNAVNSDQYTLSIITNIIKPSHEFKVNVKTTYKMDSSGWIGLFKSNVEASNATNYIDYKYTPNPYENTVTFTAPVEPGDYTIRFYSADPGQLIKQIPFRIGKPDLSGITFNLNKRAYNPEESIAIDYTGHENLAKSAWIGFFKSGKEYTNYSKYFDYRYLQPKTKGQLQFKAPSVKGNYEARMFYGETGPELLTPIPFTVTSSLDNESMKKTLNTEGVITLYGIYFDTDKSNIKSESYPLIKEIATMLNGDTSIKIRIEGHTDAKGNDNYNLNLSQKRAEAVLKLLTTTYKVSASQLQSKGYGETKPKSNNDTPEGRAKNRRVELKKI
jgi:outer membrane protein OmpA-like peptidoglycan-associated protein